LGFPSFLCNATLFCGRLVVELDLAGNRMLRESIDMSAIRRCVDGEAATVRPSSEGVCRSYHRDGVSCQDIRSAPRNRSILSTSVLARVSALLHTPYGSPAGWREGGNPSARASAVAQRVMLLVDYRCCPRGCLRLLDLRILHLWRTTMILQYPRACRLC
jgi:hypothetical protein